MVSEEDCTCTDATNPSNITSLSTDTSSAANASSNGIHSENVDRKDDVLENLQKNNCKCAEPVPTINHGISKSNDAHALGKMDKPPVESQKYPFSRVHFDTELPCLCHAHRISACTLPVKCTKADARSRRPFWSRFSWKWPRAGYFDKKNRAYELKLRENRCPYYSKPFMYCEISEGIPNGYKRDTPKSSSPKYHARSKGKPKEIAERIDIYYFDHGNSAYYQTTDSPPMLATDKCAEKTDQAATRFWAEIFGTIHIGTAFVTAFLLQLFRFVLFSVTRPLTVGILQLLADYFIKPLLSITFNALIQPVLILLYNIATSFKDLCEPISEAVGMFLREIANLCASIRIVEVKQTCAPPKACI